jgi:type IV pilus assembly protein PilB
VSVEFASRPAFSDDGFPRISLEALERIPHALAVRYNVLAYHADHDHLHVLVPDVNNEDVLDRVRSATGMRIVARAAEDKRLREKIAITYAVAEATSDERGDAPPAIRALDELHVEAVQSGASDIHIEPTTKGGRVRLRVDGILREARDLEEQLFAQVVSRVKLLGSMDIADRRLPQDGRYQIAVLDRSIDARVSSMPTIAGEKLVVRLLDMHAKVPTLEHLGMPHLVLQRYRSLVHAPYGFVVVCGPTGSGKTTTLYASMSERNDVRQHLCTVEDPVEVRMPGVTQVQVNERAGMTFAAALRSFLRQDPNALMVGEMRDPETARVAMSAALSGQLVMTTLHASDATSALERLVELGLERHSIAAGLSGVMAQRLVRRLCVACRVSRTLPASEASVLGIRSHIAVYDAVGCAQCNGTGYRGRTGIFELLPISTELRSAIITGESPALVAGIGHRENYRPMLDDGVRRLVAGDTSIAELHRVLSIGARE